MTQPLAVLLSAHEHAAIAGRPLLTDEGSRYVRELIAVSPMDDPLVAEDLLPRWDAERRRLWLGGTLVRAFRQPAPRQTAILCAFQAAGWALRHIRNPLPPEPGDEPHEARERLHEAIKNLNRGLTPDTIRFRGDGTGEGVWWEIQQGGKREKSSMWSNGKKPGPGLERVAQRM